MKDKIKIWKIKMLERRGLNVSPSLPSDRPSGDAQNYSYTPEWIREGEAEENDASDVADVPAPSALRQVS